MKRFLIQITPIAAIYPFLLLIGFLSSIASGGAVKTLFWFMPPSIVFEQIFEKDFPGMADNVLLNLLFILCFWGIISFSITSVAKWAYSTKVQPSSKSF